MKKLLLLAALLFTVSINAQNYTVKSSTGFDITSGETTGGVLKVEDGTWDIYESSKGSRYIILTSKTGNDYPVWVGEESTEVFEYNGQNYPVRFTSKGTPFIFLLGASQQPYPKYLSKE